MVAETGGLLRIAIKLLMACATANTDVDYIPLVNLLGIWFQIRDDYMNLASTDYAENKGFAEDLTEGKFSFPIVHAIRADDTNRQVLSTFRILVPFLFDEKFNRFPFRCAPKATGDAYIEEAHNFLLARGHTLV
jgi:hypothetical protein